jgi:hypothetical protein
MVEALARGEEISLPWVLATTVAAGRTLEDLAADVDAIADTE